MNRLRTCLPLLLVVILISLTSVSTTAQTPSAGALPTIGELEGIQAAINRTYSVDFESQLAASPGAQSIDPASGVTALSALILKFDNEENAQAAFDAYQAGIGDQLLEMGQGGTPTVETDPLDDLGDQAFSATLHTDSGDLETYYRFVLVREDQYFFLLSALAGSADAAGIADNLARYVADEGEEQGEQAIVVAEGGSSGGLWGFLPEADHDLLDGLVPITDETLYPQP
jgi:hypothetical protein